MRSTLNITSARIAENIRAVSELEQAAMLSRTPLERLGDRIARFTGSPAFLLLNIVFFATWMLANSGRVRGLRVFDPFPFTFLTLILSLEAILLASFVLMSQNRMSRQSDRRAHLDLQINLLAEQESTMTLQLLGKICEHLGIEVAKDQEMQDLAASLSVNKLAHAIKKDLDAT